MKRLVVLVGLLFLIVGGCNQSDPMRITDESLQAGDTARKAIAGPDIAITAFSASTGILVPGDVLHLTVSVANLGDANVNTPFHVGIKALESGKMLAMKTLQGLAAGDEVSGTVDFVIPAGKFSAAVAPGLYTVACGHDYDDADPANDRLDMVLQVKEDDPPQECMEMYFVDGNDWVPCRDASLGTQTRLVLVWHNPSHPFLAGFECGWDLTGADSFLSDFTITFPDGVQGLDIGAKKPAVGSYNIVCGFGVPMPTTQASVIATIDVLFLESAPADRIDLTLRNAIPPSIPGESRPIIVVPETYDLYTVDLRDISSSPSVQFNPETCDVRYIDDQPVKRVQALFK